MPFTSDTAPFGRLRCWYSLAACVSSICHSWVGRPIVAGSSSIFVLPGTEVPGPLYLACHQIFIMTAVSSFLLHLRLCPGMGPCHLILPAMFRLLLRSRGLASAWSPASPRCLSLIPTPCRFPQPCPFRPEGRQPARGCLSCSVLRKR